MGLYTRFYGIQSQSGLCDLHYFGHHQGRICGIAVGWLEKFLSAWCAPNISGLVVAIAAHPCIKDT